MESKLIAMILGVTLVLATAATVYTQSAFAARNVGGATFAGVTDGQTAHGLATACSHSNVATHNPNCGSAATGGASVNSGAGNAN